MFPGMLKGGREGYVCFDKKYTVSTGKCFQFSTCRARGIHGIHTNIKCPSNTLGIGLPLVPSPPEDMLHLGLKFKPVPTQLEASGFQSSQDGGRSLATVKDVEN